VASGATAGSIINAHVLTYADLEPGKIFRNVPVIAHLEGGAALVEFGMEVKGLLDVHHLFDQMGTSEYRTKVMKAKYAIGAKVDVRVLSSNPTTKRCFVTAKKSLLKASDIITSYEDCSIGQTAPGYITRVDDRGLFVTFFNRVFGRVPAKSLSLELGIDNIRENYQVGDVVHCRIANKRRVRRGKRQHKEDESDEASDDDDEDAYFWELMLSLRVNKTGDKDDNILDSGEQTTNERVHLRAGNILPAKSMKVVNLVPGKNKPDGTFVPGYAIVSIKSKYLVDESESASLLPFVECKLPYDNLLDQYDPNDIESSASLDALAEKMLTVGKSLKSKGVLLTDPRKTGYEYSSGTGRFTVVSIRPKLIEVAEAQSAPESQMQSPDLVLPSLRSKLFEGSKVLGFVTHLHNKHGAFIRFLDGLTGLVPKSKNGLNLDLFSTVVARIESVDHLSSPPKILLSASPNLGADASGSARSTLGEDTPFREGDVVHEAEVESLDFYNANLILLDKRWKGLPVQVKARIHCTMASSKPFDPKKKASKGKEGKPQSITKYHPFHGWSTGKRLKNLRVVAATVYNGVCFAELTDRTGDTTKNQDDGSAKGSELTSILTSKEQATVGSRVTGIVRQIAPFNSGLYVALGPKLTGFVPGVECSGDLDALNSLSLHFPVGARISCTVIDKLHWLKLKAQTTNSYCPKTALDRHPELIYLSVLSNSPKETPLPNSKPARGDLVIGQIQRALKPLSAPSLMLELRGGYAGRCCITELEEPDEWSNMPLGHIADAAMEDPESAIVSGDSDAEAEEETDKTAKAKGSLPRYVFSNLSTKKGKMHERNSQVFSCPGL